jgi:hypothetical protein
MTGHAGGIAGLRTSLRAMMDRVLDYLEKLDTVVAMLDRLTLPGTGAVVGLELLRPGCRSAGQPAAAAFAPGFHTGSPR